MLFTSYAWYTFSGGSTVFNTNTYNEYIDVEYRNSKVINTTTALPIGDDEVDTKASSNNFYVDVVGASNIAEVLLSISLIDVSIDENLKDIDFKYQLLHNGTVIKEGTGLDFDGSSYELTNKEVVYSDTINEFSFRVWISDNGIDGSQNDMENQSFSASIEVNAVKVRNEETNRTNISNAVVTLSPNVYSYDGLAKEPTVTVKVGSTTLVKDRDYTVLYKNNVNPGNNDSVSPPMAVVTGIGNYVGVVRKTFTISKSGIIADVSDYLGDYDGNSHTILVDVNTPSSGYTVKYGTVAGTYNLNDSPMYTNTGTYTIYYQISANGYDPLEGSSNVQINKKNISSCTTTLSATSYIYDGTSKTPTVSVVCGSRTLIENTDYTVTYPTDTTSVGSKTVTINSKGNNYIGSVTKNYSIIDSGYTITLNVNGGSVWGSGSVCSGTGITSGSGTCVKNISTGSAVGSVPSPTREGYTFSGWYSSASGGSQINVNSYTPTGDITIYAHWTANTYNISYNLNNGLSGSNAPLNATYDANVNISNPTKSISIVGNANSTGASVGSNTSANYTFSGWTATNLNTSTAKYGTSTSNVSTAWSNGNTKVSAQYFKNLISIANATVTLTANWTKPNTVTLPTLSKANATCSWYDNSSGTGTAYASGGTYTLTSSDDGLTSKNFYAKCESTVSSYAITLNVNGGSAWGSGSVCSGTGITSGSGTCVKNISTGSAVGSVPSPTREGYTFSGWYSSASGGSQINVNSYTPTGDITIYAHWTANTYNISYNLNNGLSGSNAPLNATYDANVNISNPTKSISIVGNANSTGASVGSNTSANYTFSGWTATNLNTSTAKYGTSTSNVSTAWSNGNTKVSAQYFKNLTSTANATVTLTANWTKPNTVTLPTLSKAGATCSWYDNSSGTGTAYASGGTYTLTSSDDGLTSKTFYAKCESTASSYKVTFNVNSGDSWTSTTCSTADGFSLSGTTCSKTVNGDATYGNLPTPVRSSSGSTYFQTNYVFEGWYDASSGGNQIVSSSLVDITSDIELYAHWLSYYSYSSPSTITFNVNGGNAWSSNTCQTGDGFIFNSSTSACTKSISSSSATTVNALPIPTRSDYVFAGWFSATTGGSEYVVPYTTTRTNYTYSSFTMYAHWDSASLSSLSVGDSYTITYDANGGDVGSVPSAQTKEYGVNLTLSTTVPTRSGYTFLGWSTDSSATSATYEPGEIYSSNVDAILYAVWQID